MQLKDIQPGIKYPYYSFELECKCHVVGFDIDNPSVVVVESHRAGESTGDLHRVNPVQMVPYE